MDMWGFHGIPLVRVEKELGWTLTYDFETGIKETVDWYINNQEWINDIQNGTYKESYKEN